MKRSSFCCLLVILGSVWIGCGHATPPPPAATSATVSAERAQPKLATIRLWVGPEEIVAEQALADDEIQQGLMFRKQMAENEGMLFVFASPRRTSFWMKNTLLPLTCAYLDQNGVILEIHDMRPLDESPIDAASDRVLYVLEMNQGWFDRKKIRPGMEMRTERGTLAETYFGRGPKP